MKKGFEDILNKCLDRISEKGDTIEQCLRDYPEHAAELEPLLKAALSVSEASSSIGPAPEFQRLAKHRFLTALHEKSFEKREHRVGRLLKWQRGWAVALAVVLALVLTGAGTVTASASSLPGDTLYPLKTATEKVQGFFTFGSEAKTGHYMKLAERRLNEIEALARQNRTIPQSVLDALNQDTEQALELLIKHKPAGRGLLNRLIALTANQKSVLERVIELVPPAAKLKLREALTRSEEAHGRASMLEKIYPETEKFKDTKRVPWHRNGSFLEAETAEF
jgi:hypothetical protein